MMHGWAAPVDGYLAQPLCLLRPLPLKCGLETAMAG